MNTHIRKRLEQMRADYESVSDRPWRFFYCPILHRDEETELCAGHVINQALEGADRSWTVQRKDVDNHYGTLFEGDFLALEQEVDLQVDEILTDRKLSRQFNPKIVIDGQSVDHYRPQGVVPKQHSELYIDSSGRFEKLALKMSPAELEEFLDGRWEIAFDKDVRLPALVSLLKSAHLTLFHMLGYRYALSLGGYFLCKVILGDFFLKTRGVERSSALEKARVHFKKYQSLVRPVVEMSFNFDGTLTDNTLFLCISGDRFWAFNVLVRTGTQSHGVLVPILEDAESAARFHRFLESPFPILEVKIARWDRDREIWEGSSNTHMIEWPQASLDAPMTSESLNEQDSDGGT